MFEYCYISGELLAGEGNPNCPDTENSSRNTEPFCQNSKGKFKLLKKLQSLMNKERNIYICAEIMHYSWKCIVLIIYFVAGDASMCDFVQI